MTTALWLLLACPAVLAFWLVQYAVGIDAQSRPTHTPTAHGRHRRGDTPR